MVGDTILINDISINGNNNLTNADQLSETLTGNTINALGIDASSRTIWINGQPYGNAYVNVKADDTLEKPIGGEIFNDFANNVASGEYSHAEGKGTVANNEAEHAEGTYNKSNTNTIHSVGIGTSDTNRKNAIEVMQNGDVYINDIGGYNGTNPSKSKDIATILSTVDTSDNNRFIIENDLKVNKNTTIGGTLGVTDNTTIGGTLNVTGKTTVSTLESTDNVDLESLDVTNNTTIGGTLQVWGGAVIKGGLTVKNDIEVEGLGDDNFESTDSLLHNSIIVAGFAEGSGVMKGAENSAGGNNSLAVGVGCETTNEGEYASGKYNQSNNNTIHSIGIGTSEHDRKNAIEVMQNGNVYINGIGEYNGTNPSKSKDLATILSTVDTSDNNIFIVEKDLKVNRNTTIGGTLGVTDNTTIGGTLNVTGNTTIGGTFVTGTGTSASGSHAHAEGLDTTAEGEYSHAEGLDTTASGYVAHAEGQGTTASGVYSHSEGNVTTAHGRGSHAEGLITTANGDYSHAEGQYTTANGKYSHAEGCGTEDKKTEAIGQGSHAEGYTTKADADYSHAEGYNTTASGQGSHAEGYNTTAKGDYSHVTGSYNIAEGVNSTLQGYYLFDHGIDVENSFIWLDTYVNSNNYYGCGFIKIIKPYIKDPGQTTLAGDSDPRIGCYEVQGSFWIWGDGGSRWTEKVYYPSQSQPHVYYIKDSDLYRIMTTWNENKEPDGKTSLTDSFAIYEYLEQEGSYQLIPVESAIVVGCKLAYALGIIGDGVYSSHINALNGEYGLVSDGVRAIKGYQTAIQRNVKPLEVENRDATIIGRYNRPRYDDIFEVGCGGDKFDDPVSGEILIVQQNAISVKSSGETTIPDLKSDVVAVGSYPTPNNPTPTGKWIHEMTSQLPLKPVQGVCQSFLCKDGILIGYSKEVYMYLTIDDQGKIYLGRYYKDPGSPTGGEYHTELTAKDVLTWTSVTK